MIIPISREKTKAICCQLNEKFQNTRYKTKDKHKITTTNQIAQYGNLDKENNKLFPFPQKKQHHRVTSYINITGILIKYIRNIRIRKIISKMLCSSGNPNSGPEC